MGVTRLPHEMRDSMLAGGHEVRLPRRRSSGSHSRLLAFTQHTRHGGPLGARRHTAWRWVQVNEVVKQLLVLDADARMSMVGLVAHLTARVGQPLDTAAIDDVRARLSASVT